MFLNFLVSFFILLAADRLCGWPSGFKRVLLAAGLGGIYGGACLLPGFSFLGNAFWRLVGFGLMSWLAYGRHALRRGAVFVLLRMALEGIVMDGGKAGMLLGIAAGIGVMSLLGLRDGGIRRHCLPVELSYGGKKMRIVALQDTGNGLRDPISGAPVLVVGADIARAFTGLTDRQLRQPVETMGSVPGLRLIPYHTVGQRDGLMLALRFPRVKIGSWQGSTLVAFSPEVFREQEGYQALTGGII